MTFTLADTATKTSLQTLLARWSAAAAVLQQGKPVGTVQPNNEVAPPTDTGEAFGLSPASLTVTIGLGPVAVRRTASASRPTNPRCSPHLPTLNGDTLDPKFTGGELSVQACADDPQVCYHAVRNLARLGRSIVTPFWAVLGFGRASAGPGQQTPRNLLGFKDGTRNVETDDAVLAVRLGARTATSRGWRAAPTRWSARSACCWRRGTPTASAISRRIIGRHKEEGSPLTGTGEMRHPELRGEGRRRASR